MGSAAAILSGSPSREAAQAELDLFAPSAHGGGERADAGEVPGAGGLRELFAGVHHLHQQRGRRLRLAGLAHGDAGAPHQRLGPAHGVLEGAERLVDVDGAAQREAALGRGRPCIAIGVERAGEIAVALLERGEIELEAGRHAQRVEGINHGTIALSGVPRRQTRGVWGGPWAPTIVKQQ